MSTNIFERASKLKLRFNNKQGLLSTEDLWELNLTKLDELAIEIDNQLEKKTKSFIGSKTSGQSLLELKLNILKHIISVKMNAEEVAKNRAVKNAKLEELKQLALSKQSQELQGKSLEEINKMIEDLSKEDVVLED